MAGPVWFDTTKMNRRVKMLWWTALMSGEYEQCRGRLTDDGGFCCLGVLTDLYLKEKQETWKEFSNLMTLPTEVIKWAGLKLHDPEVGPRSDYDPHPVIASGANDSLQEKFPKIARRVAQYL